MLKNINDSIGNKDENRLLFSKLTVLSPPYDFVNGTCELLVCILSDPLICLRLEFAQVSSTLELRKHQRQEISVIILKWTQDMLQNVYLEMRHTALCLRLFLHYLLEELNCF